MMGKWILSAALSVQLRSRSLKKSWMSDTGGSQGVSKIFWLEACDDVPFSRWLGCGLFNHIGGLGAAEAQV
jgi:hypothetical protein